MCHGKVQSSYALANTQAEFSLGYNFSPEFVVIKGNIIGANSLFDKNIDNTGCFFTTCKLLTDTTKIKLDNIGTSDNPVF